MARLRQMSHMETMKENQGSGKSNAPISYPISDQLALQTRRGGYWLTSSGEGEGEPNIQRIVLKVHDNMISA